MNSERKEFLKVVKFSCINLSYILENIFKKLTSRLFFTLVLSSSLKIGHTFAILAFSEKPFRSMYLFIIFANLLSITFADSLMTFTGVPPESVAMSELNELIMIYLCLE